MMTLSVLSLSVFSLTGCNGDDQEIRIYKYPEATYSSQWLDFGEVEDGETLVRSFTIQNTGDLPMGVETIMEGEGHIEDFEVFFDAALITCPEAEEEDTAAAEAKAGWAPPGPGLALDKTEVDFGTVAAGDTAFGTLKITNDGDEDLSVTAVSVTGDTEGVFTLVGAYDGSTVAVGASLDVVLQYKPTDTAGDEATLVIVTNSETTVTSVVIKGNSAGTGTDSGETGEDTDDTDPVDSDPDTDTPGDDQVLFVLEKDCSIAVDVTFDPITVGETYGSVIVGTKTQSREDNNDAEYFADLDKSSSIIYLQGTGLRGDGRMVVRPRTVDFGHVWTGLEEVRYVEVLNAGDGDLTLTEPVLDETCAESFSISWSYIAEGETTKVLEGGTQTLVEVTFIPVDNRDAFCSMTITSDDDDTPEVQVNLQGNAGRDPENEPPTVTIRSPAPGYVHNTPSDIPFELNVFDANQPADSLQCRIKSAVQLGATVASCVPDNESGHVYVDVPLEVLDAGVDTMLVEVLDGSSTAAYASIPIIVSAAPAESDDDGDGFSEFDTGALYFDCNDANINTYPKAAEVPDNDDNDCDGAVDEGTSKADDDGDSFTEEDGDCDDYDPNTFPGAPESPDRVDNNCDGTVDEQTTLYDDDGDGYAEVNNDCDDSDPDINPGGIEICDDKDNNCNGLKDDGCLEINSEPYVVGGIDMTQTACEVGESIQLSVFVYDADEQEISYTWTADGGTIDNPTAPTVTWTAPTQEELQNTEGDIYKFYVVTADEDLNQAWAFADIAVYPEEDLYGDFLEVVTVPSSGPFGCATGGSNRTGLVLGALGLLGLVGLRRRR